MGEKVGGWGQCESCQCSSLTSQTEGQRDALWSETNNNRNVSTGPLARPFARSLAPLTRSLAPHNSLRSRAVRRLFIRLLAHFAHSLARGKVNYKMAILSVFFPFFDHSDLRYSFQNLEGQRIIFLPHLQVGKKVPSKNRKESRKHFPQILLFRSQEGMRGQAEA